MTQEKNVTPAALDIATFDLTRSAMIEASAGTGKTFTISNLVVRLLLGRGMKSPELDFSEALDIENILIVTFTNAAASDLKARILEKIRSVRIDFEKIKNGGYAQIETFDKTTRSIIERYISEKSSENTASFYARLLKRAERAIDNAAISTIHSFCNRALNQVYTFEAGRAFNVELAVKCSDQEKQAILDVWRELFYRNESGLDLKALDQALSCKVPGELKELKILENLRLVDSTDGYYGFSVNLGTQDNLRYEEIKFSREDRLSIDKRLKKVLEFYRKKLSVSPDEVISEYDTIKKFLPQAVTSEGKPGSLYQRNDGKDSVFLKGLIAFLQSLSDRISANPDDLMFFTELIKELCKERKGDPEVIEKSLLIAYSPKREKFNSFDDITDFESSILKIVRYCESKQNEANLAAKEIRTLVAIKIMLRTDELCQSDNLISSNEVLRQLAVSLSGGSDRALNLAGQLRSRYPVVMIDEFQDTDPVQFEVFSRLYLSEQSAQDKCCCYLIGDPKQSIYSFRGSDINSYNKAKQLVLSCGGNLYSLETNYRSTKKIIEGVNTLFKESEDDKKACPHPFDYSGKAETALDSHIRFSPVNAPDGDDSKTFYFEDDSGVIGNYYRTVLHDKNIGSLQTCVAKATADVIVKCLSCGVIEEKGVKRKVKPSDIAVLVAKKAENDYIEKALRERNIRSVYFSDHNSVLANIETKNGELNKQLKVTAEAVNIVYFMEAVCSYSQIRNVYRLLGSSLMGLNRAEYEKHINGRYFDDEITILRECRRKWEEYGFFSAFSHYAQRHDLIKKFLRRENGERALTNYFQIAEIIQSVNSKVIGAQAQLLWFKECLKSETQSTFSEDDTKKRLESEQSLVKVLTYFMSKGLQFPIVLMPYMYTDQIKDKSDICYDPSINHLVYTADRSVRIELDGQSYSADTLIKAALWQERTRLLYVAMTRAQLANFVFFGIDKKTDKKNGETQSVAPSVLNSLVASFSKANKEVIYNPKLYRELDGTSFDNNPEKYYQADEGVQDGSYEVSSLESADVDRSFRVSSYTEIASGGHNDIFRPGEDEPYAPLETDSQSRVKDLGAFARVKGTRIGTFMHKALELLLSRDIRERNDHGFLYEFSKETLRNDIYGIFTDTDRDYCSDLSSWLYEIIHAKLPVETAQNTYASLCSLGAKDCARELDYYLPCAHFDMNVFNRICQKFYKDVLEQFSIKAEQELPPLIKDDFSGYLTGSLDLVARFNHKGSDRYYLCDYKTNYLGESRSDYSVQELIKSIFSSRYDVQILLYSVALKRFLKMNNRLDEKGEIVGGVMYLYLRGMSVKDSGELSDGVVLLSPDPALVDELDRMLNV
ncbi:MAG: UvrD-helicase domain-containing protein [Succinivibrio sp.]